MPRLSSNPEKVRSKKNPGATYRVGETILHNGIYKVLHRGHRVSHYVVLLAGQTFPRCARCAENVKFELFEASTSIQDDPDFRVLLYEIPHPRPAARKKEDDEVA